MVDGGCWILDAGYRILVNSFLLPKVFYLCNIQPLTFNFQPSTNDPPIFHMHDPVAHCCEFFVVGNNQETLLVPVS